MAQIDKPNLHFNTVLYTGNETARSITGVGFQPDFVWGKNRDSTNWHNLEDAVRGATKRLSSNSTDAEATETTNFTSFDSDGFSVGTGHNVNKNGSNIVVWNWKAGGAGSSNTDGSITATVSANTTSGFSIIKWTGTGSNGTIGHGLGAVPKVYIVKNLDSVGKFWFFPTFFNNANEYLDGFTSTAGLQTDGNGLTNSTLPTNSVISLGTSSTINTSGNDIICYAFAEKKGFSKFGNYTGNGNANGTFIYTGFKPAFVMIKRTDTTGNWAMKDTKRQEYNGQDIILYADTTNYESQFAANKFDILSNGFKMRETSGIYNASGGGYIYMAFAENPIVGSNNIPATAR
tara:strand:+ start:9 stop:1046 length:1038 start_codon:yes stop_codon:yes gene_type:complete